MTYEQMSLVDKDVSSGVKTTIRSLVVAVCRICGYKVYLPVALFYLPDINLLQKL